MSNADQDFDRLGSLDPASLGSESKRLYDDIVHYFDVYYTYKLEDGRMVGPFGIELHTPEAGQCWLGMTKALAKMTDLPPLAREVAILVTGAHTKAAYQIYAHSAVSGLPQSDLDLLLNGECPDHLDRSCKIAFKMATELCKPGVLKEDVWNEAVEGLGRSAAIAVVHYVGFYKYVSTILNGFGAKVP